MSLRRLARRLRTSVALGLPPVLAPAMVFVPLGVLLGPWGTNVLDARVAGQVSQAGVTLGITVTVSGEFTEWGPRMATLVVAVVAIHLVAGPILFRRALTRAGEVGGAGQPTQPSV